MSATRDVRRKKRKEVKIVWDVTIGNEALFEDRLCLIQHTAEVIRKNGMAPNFVIVIHGPATKFVANSISKTKFGNECLGRLPAIQKIIVEMNEDGMRFVQCQVPMIRKDVSKDNILPFVSVSETVFYDLAILQMKGYAYIPIYEM